MIFSNDELSRYMAFAYNLATRSPDPSNQNGAILLHRKPDSTLEIVAEGYNHIYAGIPFEVEDRTIKLQRIEHAERDCIYSAALRGVSCGGAVLVTPWAACYDCARAIIASGISTLVYHKQRNDLTPDRWKDAVDESLVWMGNAGINIIGLDGDILGAFPVIVNGEKWSPVSEAVV